MSTPTAHKFGLSFEYFPPKSLDASFRLWNAIETLSAFDPDFVSITYGAGGTTREITRSAVGVVAKNYDYEVAGHLTCVGATKAETMAVAREYGEVGATQIVALRGDPPKGEDKFTPHPDGFSGSLELIRALADLNQFKIRVSAYPNTHPEAASAQADIDALKAKFDAGAHSAISQFFFEKDDFLFFRDACVKAGITQKIIPGIFPIENWSKTRNFAKMCGTPTPDWMDSAFGNCKDRETERLLSTAMCTELCDDLLSEGVEDLHFYTLNDPSLTREVCRALGRTLRHPKLRAAS